MAAPAIAGELSSWQFDQGQNSLEFMTDEGVQPRAQLVPDPTRLVIDLPGTTLGNVERSQFVGGAIQQVRIGQWDSNTARIVVELAPGYMIDPQQIQFRGLTATHWTVQLPEPQYAPASTVMLPSPAPSPSQSAAPSGSLNSFNPSPSPLPSPLPSSSPLPSPSPLPSARPAPSPLLPSSSVPSPVPSPTPNPITNPITNPTTSSATPDPALIAAPPTNTPDTNVAIVDETMTQVEGLRITDDGIFVRTRGESPDVEVERSRDRRSITITVENSVLSPQLTERELAVEQYNIESLQFIQTSDTPSDVQIVLNVDRDSPNWRASASGLGGIVLLPAERIVANRSSRDDDSRDDDSGDDSRNNSRDRDSGDNDSRSNDSRSNSARNNNSRDRDSRNETNTASRDRDRNASQSNSPPAESAVPTAPVAPTVATAPDPSSLPLATIEGIEFDSSGTQLLIRSDRPVSYVGGWRSGMYEVTLSPAQLAAQVTGPELDSSSPLLRVRLRQEEDDTVLIRIQPASGIRFGALNALNPQLLALSMERVQTPVAVTPTTSATAASFPASAASFPSGSITMPSIPSGRLVVVVDPGHGGADVGAVGINDLYEADVVLAISQQVGAILQQQGIYVIMTRTDDREIDLEPRVQMAEQANATLFVSIHANSMGMDRPDVNGTETYYYSSGEGLAQVIQNSIVSNIDMNDRGVRQARFYVLRRTTMPAVLVEVGFVTGSEDGPRLADASFQSRMAQAIAQGILTYIQQNALSQ